KRGWPLQFAQARRVRRANVQGNVISKFTKQPAGVEVIIRRVLKRRRLRFTDVDPDRNRRPSPAFAQFVHPFRYNIGAVIVKTEPVHQRLSFREAKDPRFGVSGLGFGGDRADLDETKAERCPCRNRNAVFIQPRCKSDWIWKRYSKKDSRFWSRLKNFESAQRNI